MGTIRELPAEEIEALLRTAIVGRIACCGHGATGDGRPYLVPLAYGYDGDAVYAHSGPGRKLDLMRAEPRVTFEVDEAEAPDRWRSVIAEGTFEEIDRPAAARRRPCSHLWLGRRSGPRVADGRLPHSLDVALRPL